LDASECFTEQTSAHTGGVTPSSSHSDNQSDQSLTEHHMLPCLKTERVNLFPQFTSCSKKATIEQSEDEIEELSKITVEDIRHDVSIREVKHPDYLSSSQRVSSDTEDVSSSQSSLELLGMVASQKKLEELDLEPERCEPGVVNATVECAGHSQAPEQMSDCGGRVPCLLKEITCPVKASKAPSKVSEADEAADKKKESFASRPQDTKKTSEADEAADKKKEGFASRPQDTKKTRRKLQPATAMMLKEFTSADLDVDTKREERGKSSSGVASGRSDALIRLLKARPVRRV